MTLKTKKIILAETQSTQRKTKIILMSSWAKSKDLGYALFT